MSDIVKNENISEVNCLIKLDNIANFNSFQSNIFYVRGTPWVVLFEKNCFTLCVSLISKIENDSKDWAIAAEYSVDIIPIELHINFIKKNFTGAVFHHGRMSRKCSLISWNDLTQPENGFVTNDSCELEIKVSVSPLQNSIQNEWLKFESIQKCCDENSGEKYRMTVKVFGSFIGVCSPPIHLKNSECRIVLKKISSRPDGNANEKFIQIVLRVMENEFNGADQIIMSCKLIPFDPNMQPLQKQQKAFPCEILLNLITWDELIKPANCYIQNKIFILEIEFKSAALKHRECNDGGDDKLACIICLERLNGPASSLLCGHIFCTACIKESIERRKLCPTCNQPATVRQLRKVFLPLQ